MIKPAQLRKSCQVAFHHYNKVFISHFCFLIFHKCINILLFIGQFLKPALAFSYSFGISFTPPILSLPSPHYQPNYPLPDKNLRKSFVYVVRIDNLVGKEHYSLAKGGGQANPNRIFSQEPIITFGE